MNTSIQLRIHRLTGITTNQILTDLNRFFAKQARAARKQANRLKRNLKKQARKKARLQEEMHLQKRRMEQMEERKLLFKDMDPAEKAIFLYKETFAVSGFNLNNWLEFEFTLRRILEEEFFDVSYHHQSKEKLLKAKVGVDDETAQALEELFSLSKKLRLIRKRIRGTRNSESNDLAMQRCQLFSNARTIARNLLDSVYKDELLEAYLKLCWTKRLSASSTVTHQRTVSPHNKRASIKRFNPQRKEKRAWQEIAWSEKTYALAV